MVATGTEYSAEALERSAEAFGLRLVVLYGSRAGGSNLPPSPESDIDLAVQGCAREQIPACHVALSRALGTLSLDLVRLEDADPLFRYEIMAHGVLLYGDPDRFADYRSYAYRDFVDSADLRALEDRLFRRKMDRLRERLDAQA